MKIAAIVLFGILVSSATVLRAASPSQEWSPVVVPTGEYRQQVKATPIENRPGRFLHVYGNTVRYRQQVSTGNGGRPVRRIVIGRTRQSR